MSNKTYASHESTAMPRGLSFSLSLTICSTLELFVVRLILLIVKSLLQVQYKVLVDAS